MMGASLPGQCATLAHVPFLRMIAGMVSMVGVGLDTELVHAQKCKEVWRQLNGSASLYRNTVVQALLNVEEDHGYYWEEGQQPYRWEVGQEVYRARHGLDRNIGFRTQKWKRLVEG